MESEAEPVLRDLEQMRDHFESAAARPSDKKVPYYIHDAMTSTFKRTSEFVMPFLSPTQRDTIMNYQRKLGEKPSMDYGEAKQLGLEFRAFVLPFLPRRSAGGEYSRRYERRIAQLEEELNRLSSNPALEKKVAKLEEEVRKVKFSSMAWMQTEEKEQEDVLKKYKAAEKKVFVIMPFDPLFEDVWKGGIERACNSSEFACLRVDKISLSTWITEDIEKFIEIADVVICDITGNNPNVMFELGWALAKAKKPIVIRQKDDSNVVPFDVHGMRYIPYANSWSGIESLFKQMCKFITSTSETLETEKLQEKKKKAK